MVFFRHWYITQPTVTTKVQIIKAIGDLSSALHQQVNIRGKEEMAVLQNMNDILNNTTTVLVEKKKKVTFKDPIPEPRVGQSGGNLQQSSKTALAPRVVAATIDKPLRTVPISGPTTHSKYTQALANIASRGLSTRSRPPLNMTELVQAVIDDDPTAAAELTNEVFDKESGKFLKYRKLITHPKYCKVWMHSSANKFGQLAQGVGGRIKGTDTFFYQQTPSSRRQVERRNLCQICL
jgi:hypothetical protein